MSEIKMDGAKQQLRELVATYQRPLRGKFAVLAPLRSELLELADKGASGGEIVSMLAQCGITVSKDTVGRFLRFEEKKERSSGAKKDQHGGSANGTMQRIATHASSGGGKESKP